MDQNLGIFQVPVTFEQNEFWQKKITQWLTPYKGTSVPNLKAFEEVGCRFSLFLSHLTWNDPCEMYSFVARFAEFSVIQGT